MGVRVQSEPICPGEELARMQGTGTRAGAMVCFVGMVRSGDRQPITSMTIEHYPGMTESAISAHVEKARGRWPLLDCRIVHRFGELLPGETIVMVAVQAAHRSDAFQAADFLMDYLKSRAPFWKQEQTPSGSRWVEANAEDENSLSRWNE